MSHELQVDVALTEEQERFVFSEKAFPAFVGGFGSGKTQALVVRSIMGKLAEPSLDRGFFAPTYDLIRLIAWPRFTSILDQWGIGYTLNKSDAILHLETGGNIIFRTLDTPERIIGFEIADADVDELDTLPLEHAKDAWFKILARVRQRKKNEARNTVGVGTTPEGFRFVYQQWEKKGGPDYEIIRAKTKSNPFNPKSYVKSLEENYPPQLLKAYLDGEFTNLKLGCVYPSFDRKKNHTSELILPREPLFIGMDFNVGKMAAAICVERNGSPRQLAEICNVADTPAMIEEIRDRYDRHPITIFPDSSGSSSKTISASISDISLLRAQNWIVRARKKNPYVRERVVSVNAMFLNGRGERRLLINTDECPVTTECLEQQAYDEKGKPDKDSGVDHNPDALGYYIVNKFPATHTQRPPQPRTKPKKHRSPFTFDEVAGYREEKAGPRTF